MAQWTVCDYLENILHIIRRPTVSSKPQSYPAISTATQVLRANPRRKGFICCNDPRGGGGDILWLFYGAQDPTSTSFTVFLLPNQILESEYAGELRLGWASQVSSQALITEFVE